MRLALGVWVAVVSVACGASLSFTRTDNGSHATLPRGPVQVEVFTTGRPLRPNAELGIMVSERGDSRDEDAEVVAQMREYAGELGCDALVLVDVEALHRGSCLIYTAPPVMAPPPVPSASTSSAGCIPNVAQACYGANGCRGTQTCSTDGKSYSPCACAAQ